MSCAVSERSGGFCIRFNYGVRSGSKMTRKCDTTVFGIKLEAENGIQALRYRLNTPFPQTRTDFFALVVPKWYASKIATFHAVKAGLGLYNTTREYWCSVKLLMVNYGDVIFVF